MITYCEPIQGLDINGNEVTCTLKISVTIKDAIQIQRRHMQQVASERKRQLHTLTEDQLLDEFMILNWATTEELMGTHGEELK